MPETGAHSLAMKPLSIALPDELRSFVDAQAVARGDAQPDGYVCDLIRREQERLHVRDQLLAGAESAVAQAANDAWFNRLRDQTRRRPTT